MPTPAEGRVARLMVAEQEAMKLLRPRAEGRALGAATAEAAGVGSPSSACEPGCERHESALRAV
jgi:hypothetical protein